MICVKSDTYYGRKGVVFRLNRQPQKGNWTRIPTLIGIGFKRKGKNLNHSLDQALLGLLILVIGEQTGTFCRINISFNRF